ncbi:hypothetical protein QOT17_023531 [Balamuthia mandrillaris]
MEEAFQLVGSDSRVQLGFLALLHGPTYAAKQFGCSSGTACYWRDKLLDPSYHHGSWGGHRFQKFSAEVEEQILNFVGARCQSHPNTTIRQYCALLREAGLPDITRSWLQRFLHKRSLEARRQQEQAARDRVNEELLKEWLKSIPQLPWGVLKFMDEFVLEKVYETGEDLYMTLLLDANREENPTGVNYRAGKRTPNYFLSFVVSMINQGFLTRGDLLIVNQALTPGIDTIKDQLDHVLNATGVTMTVLPIAPSSSSSSSSLQLNPCELVFALMRVLLANLRPWAASNGVALWQQALLALAHISYADLLGFYWQCTQRTSQAEDSSCPL